ncbi:MAG: helix-turn-helix domain-containing protein [Oscillospiraceae bacterium]|jgi:transcriptional regulator with XRE-family HTH domain|nr:helix-turn-helix domain-containing protein [Oscillospiraceae bacterium]
MLGKKIQQLRRDNGLSQEELASKLTISRQAISKWELGESMPDTENVVQLSKLFKVTTDYLLNDEYEFETKKVVDEQIIESQSDNTDESSLDKSFNFKKYIKKHKVWIITVASAVVLAVIAALVMLFLARTNYVLIYDNSPDSPEVFKFLSNNSIKTRLKDGDIFVSENIVEEVQLILRENGFTPVGGYGHAVDYIQVAEDIKKQIIQLPQIDDALVTIKDRCVSVVLVIANDEKLPDTEINSIYKLIGTNVLPWYEIEISDSNLNFYTINGD